MARTTEEHLVWCKQRAVEYLPHDPQQAFSSMASDLNKHDGTRGHIGSELGLALLMGGQLESPEEMRRFIEGYN